MNNKPAEASDDFQFVSDSLNNTINLKSFHFVLVKSSDFSDDTNSVASVEGYYVAEQGAHEKHQGQNTHFETLVTNDAAYIKHDGGEWLLYRTTAMLQAIQSQGLRTSSASALPTLPGWGVIEPQWYNFSYVSEVTLRGVTTHQYAGMPGMLLANVSSPLADSQLLLWIDPKTKYLVQLATSYEYEKWRQATPKSLFSIRGSGTSQGSNVSHSAPAEQTPAPIETQAYVEMSLDRFNDPTILLPTP